MAKVSVLIAVYNASAYLNKCIDSILGQTLTDLQVVCVDDCSTDNSLSILKDYEQHDNRVEVVHLEKNVGLAKARNIALARASGDYICMVDADDWYSIDALQLAADTLDAHQETGCVLFRFVLAYPGDNDFILKDFPSAEFSVMSGAEACRMSLTWQIHGIYMVRADIHKRYPYDETCRVYSDENTCRMHYVVSKEVRSCSGVYYYRQHNQSVTHSVSVYRFDRLKAKESLMAQLKTVDVGADITGMLTNQLWLDVVDLYMFLHVHGRELSEADRRYGLAELKRVWSTIDRTLLDPQTLRKLGYRHMPTWTLFRLQEWIYFTLRGFLGKNK